MRRICFYLPLPGERLLFFSRLALTFCPAHFCDLALQELQLPVVRVKYWIPCSLPMAVACPQHLACSMRRGVCRYST